MKKKYLAILLSLAMMVSTASCGQDAETSGKREGGSSAGESRTSGADETGASASGENNEQNDLADAADPSEDIEGTVLVYLPAKILANDHAVFERDKYGNVVNCTLQKNGDGAISNYFTAEIREDDHSYYINTSPNATASDDYYYFTFNDNGALVSVNSQLWTLTYSDQEGSAFKETIYDDKKVRYHYYDEAYRLTDSYSYDSGSDEPYYEEHNTYDDQGRLIEERRTSYKRHYDFAGTHTLFCEMNRPLEFFEQTGDNTYQVRTCQCTYDDAGHVLTEQHITTEDGKVRESYEYEYDADGNMIQMIDRNTKPDTYGGDRTYGYDADGNLISFAHPTTILLQPYRVMDDPLLLAFLALHGYDTID